MIQDDNMKKCTCCQEILDINFFGTQGKRNRRDSNCKKCRNQKRKIYNKNNKEKRSATRKAYYQKNLNKMRQEKIRCDCSPESIRGLLGFRQRRQPSS